jgi:hypothetical protein
MLDPKHVLYIAKKFLDVCLDPDELTKSLAVCLLLEVGQTLDLAAASEVCIYDVIIGGRFAPPYKYINKYIPQKQPKLQQQQHLCLTVMLHPGLSPSPLTPV